MLQQCLNIYLQNYNLSIKFQFGFRKDHRTTDNIFILKTLVNKYLDIKKDNFYLCYVDFSKAFDTVWRSALMYKMYKKGIGGGGAFINFFVICTLTQCNTMYSCKNNNILSEPFRAN